MTPALTPAPLRTAAAGIGAAVYVSGIQPCRGTSAIFMPKPTMMSASAASRHGEAGSAATTSRICTLPFGSPAASMTKAISSTASPSSANAI